MDTAEKNGICCETGTLNKWMMITDETASDVTVEKESCKNIKQHCKRLLLLKYYPRNMHFPEILRPQSRH